MPERPTRDDVRAAITAAFTTPDGGIQAVRWDENGPPYRLHERAADAVMPFVDQAFQAGIGAGRGFGDYMDEWVYGFGPRPRTVGENREHLWPCGCLRNEAGAHRGGCPGYPNG